MEFIAQTNHTVYIIIINVVWQIGVCLFYNMSSLLGGLSSSNVYSSMVKAALEEEKNSVAWVVGKPVVGYMNLRCSCVSAGQN